MLASFMWRIYSRFIHGTQPWPKQVPLIMLKCLCLWMGTLPPRWIGRDLLMLTRGLFLTTQTGFQLVSRMVVSQNIWLNIHLTLFQTVLTWGSLSYMTWHLTWVILQPCPLLQTRVWVIMHWDKDKSLELRLTGQWIGGLTPNIHKGLTCIKDEKQSFSVA